MPADLLQIRANDVRDSFKIIDIFQHLFYALSANLLQSDIRAHSKKEIKRRNRNFYSYEIQY